MRAALLRASGRRIGTHSIEADLDRFAKRLGRRRTVAVLELCNAKPFVAGEFGTDADCLDYLPWPNSG
jgi:hypothetical protein